MNHKPHSLILRTRSLPGVSRSVRADVESCVAPSEERNDALHVDLASA